MQNVVPKYLEQYDNNNNNNNKSCANWQILEARTI